MSILFSGFVLVFFILFCYNIYTYGLLKKSEREGLVSSISEDDENTLLGKELIDEKIVYKIVSSERQDNEKNYSDIPDNGQAVQFLTNDEDHETYLINPITGNSFYINHNHLTIKVKSIKQNKFPENSICVNAVSKCKGCESVTNWEIFLLPIRNISRTDEEEPKKETKKKG